MVASIVIGTLVFGYAGLTLYRFGKRSKEGKCAACSIKDSCQTKCYSYE